MTASQIKSELNKTIAELSTSNLKKVYGFVNNIVKENTEDDDWASDVSPEEIKAIEAGIDDLKKGKTIPHKQAMENIRSRYKK